MAAELRGPGRRPGHQQAEFDELLGRGERGIGTGVQHPGELREADRVELGGREKRPAGCRADDLQGVQREGGEVGDRIELGRGG